LKNVHWPYYLSIEQDIANLSRYIELDEANFSTYSVELARLFLATGSEIDVVLKGLCSLLAPNEKVTNIIHYQRLLSDQCPSLINQTAKCQRHGLSFTPWKSWADNESPSWWKNHNSVKHNRGLHYDQANLGNVLSTAAGLYLVNLHYNYQLAKRETDYPLLDLEHTVAALPRQADLFRLDCPFTYLNG
jgi:hypothetical protein